MFISFIKCLPNEEYTLSNEGDKNKTTKMLENFDDNYDMTDAGGNDIAVFRLIKSTAGFYNNLTFVSLKYILKNSGKGKW